MDALAEATGVITTHCITSYKIRYGHHPPQVRTNRRYLRRTPDHPASPERVETAMSQRCVMSMAACVMGLLLTGHKMLVQIWQRWLKCLVGSVKPQKARVVVVQAIDIRDPNRWPRILVLSIQLVDPNHVWAWWESPVTGPSLPLACVLDHSANTTVSKDYVACAEARHSCRGLKKYAYLSHRRPSKVVVIHLYVYVYGPGPQLTFTLQLIPVVSPAAPFGRICICPPLPTKHKFTSFLPRSLRPESSAPICSPPAKLFSAPALPYLALGRAAVSQKRLSSRTDISFVSPTCTLYKL